MFAEMEINPFLNQDRIAFKPKQSLESQFEIGIPEWQQKFSSIYRDNYIPLDLSNNKCKIDKPYLKPNYSTIHFNNPSDNQFLSSNKRDFHYIKMRKEDRSILDESTKNFIRNSKIILGSDNYRKNTIYQSEYIDPKDVKNPVNDKINFQYNEYRIHPIYQIPIYKDPKQMFGFDYWNRDKNKRYISNRNESYINNDYTKVWDPITNRFLPGSLRGKNYLSKSVNIKN